MNCHGSCAFGSHKSLTKKIKRHRKHRGLKKVKKIKKSKNSIGKSVRKKRRSSCHYGERPSLVQSYLGTGPLDFIEHEKNVPLWAKSNFYTTFKE